MQPWWERYPDRYTFEIQQLESLGYEYSKDEEEFKAGCLVINIKYPLNDGTTPLIARFPDSYPYFRFSITAPELKLNRHQNQFTKDLCLLVMDTEAWRTSDYLANFLKERIPHVLNVVGSNDKIFIKENEENVGEPLSAFLHCVANSSLIIGDWELLEEANTGTLKIKYICKEPFRGIVSSIYDKNKNYLDGFDDNISSIYSDNLTGYWIRLKERPDISSVDDLLSYLKNINPNYIKPIFKKGPYILGLVYKDEIRWRETGQDWLFLICTKEKLESNKKSSDKKTVWRILKTDYGGLNHLLLRVPELKSFNKKRALIVGLGSLGSTVVLQLARANIGTLKLVDYDIVSIGNTVRWQLGWQFTGFFKSQALETYIKSNYPHVNIDYSEPMRIGDTYATGENRDRLKIESLLSDVDIVIDASAEFGINNFLSDLSLEFNIPYLWLTTTHGVWGGVIGRVKPNITQGCWGCFQLHLEKGSIKIPNQKKLDEIQPMGCANMTFTGAGVDCDQIALTASRLIISTLCAGENALYPDVKWDVGVLDLRSEEGSIIEPSWLTYTLIKHKDCPKCNI